MAEIKIGDQLILEGQSAYGKDIINRHGSVWDVTGKTFLNNMDHYFIESEKATVDSGGVWRDTMYKVKDGRWLRAVDEDFKIVSHGKLEMEIVI
jgi:hypothetical protein